jgi:hypothetical protein
MRKLFAGWPVPAENNGEKAFGEELPDKNSGWAMTNIFYEEFNYHQMFSMRCAP